MKVGATSDQFFFGKTIEENEAILKRELMTAFIFLAHEIVKESIVPTPGEPLSMTLELREDNLCFTFVLLTDRDVTDKGTLIPHEPDTIYFCP